MNVRGDEYARVYLRGQRIMHSLTLERVCVRSPEFRVHVCIYAVSHRNAGGRE